MSNRQTGLEYIEGDVAQQQCYAKELTCCGECTGWCKAWLPCFGCFCCCCESPYITVPQGSKALLLNFDKYQRTLGAGLHYVNPLTQKTIVVDCRISVANLPSQRLMTKDNIGISVDSCVYYHIIQPHLTTFRVGDVAASLIKVTGGLIKNTVAAFTFQDLLEKKTEIADDVDKQLEPVIKNWGITVDNVCIKNFGISKELQSELVSAPIARRNAESKIISAKAQVQIARMLGQRSQVLDSPTAIQVRYLETLKELARNPQSCMIYRSQNG